MPASRQKSMCIDPSLAALPVRDAPDSRRLNPLLYLIMKPGITVALPILEVDMAARSSLDRQFVPLLEPNSHRTRTEHVQNEEYFSVRTERATVVLGRVLN